VQKIRLCTPYWKQRYAICRSEVL